MTAIVGASNRDRPRRARVAAFAEVVLLVALALGAVPFNAWVSNRLWAPLAARGLWAFDRWALAEVAFCIEAAALCAVAARTSGLGPGSPAGWRRRGGRIAAVWLVGPIGVVTVYAHLTARPFHGLPPSSWLFGSVAQELLFTGFIYGRLEAVFGRPAEGWRGAFALPMLLTPVLFSAWHWPNLFTLEPGYMAFQFAYTLLLGWLNLQMRRWTGSLWPAASNHVAVNFLASIT